MRLVTAGHFDAMKLAGASLDADLTLRSYVVAVGRSSIEVRTDVLQAGRLIHFAHTVMVALSEDMARTVAVAPLDLRAENVFSSAAPPGAGADPFVAERAAMAAAHVRHRRKRRSQSNHLGTRDSAPPGAAEMAELHGVFKSNVQARESGDAAGRLQALRPMGGTEVTSSMVVFSEERNCHGKLFGGFIARHAFEQAYFAAMKFGGALPVPLGFDEMVFERPVSIGDMVRFRAQVVHAADRGPGRPRAVKRS
jgi:acyl-coenzyme A thioesterase 9